MAVEPVGGVKGKQNKLCLGGVGAYKLYVPKD
jgi:hypothetical protein